MALVTSLFHDAGYIASSTTGSTATAPSSRCITSRAARAFLARFLPTIGMETWVPVSTRIVHFTGYEIKLVRFSSPDARDRKLGHLLGTADLIAQMADRCYLEKCRDRLYPEFVLGGIAAAPGSDGTLQVRYSSGLGSAAPDAAIRARDARRSARGRVRTRLSATWKPLFGGKNPYLEAIDRNLEYPAPHVARRALAHAAAESAAVHLRGQSTRTGARPDGESVEGALGLTAPGRSGPVDAAT